MVPTTSDWVFQTSAEKAVYLSSTGEVPTAGALCTALGLSAAPGNASTM